MAGHRRPVCCPQAPTAIAVLPKEIWTYPKSWVAKQYNLKRWTVMPGGGAAPASAVLSTVSSLVWRPVSACTLCLSQIPAAETVLGSGTAGSMLPPSIDMGAHLLVRRTLCRA